MNGERVAEGTAGVKKSGRPQGPCLGLLARRRRSRGGLGRRQDFLHGLLKFSDVGVLEFLAEPVVGVFGRASDRHTGIVEFSA